LPVFSPASAPLRRGVLLSDFVRLTAALSDRYSLERELGQGGMATVYLAEDRKHQRKVAIKVLRPELSVSLGVERFAREIAVAARLQHPHILGVLDSGQADGFFFYVMPYVEGETLRDRLLRGGELPVHEALRLLGEMADALAAAHRSGVVHRDIKPENIMIAGRHAMVMDFGVAKALTESTGSHQLTSVGVALGTPTYMAPEQATADPQMDGRVDIYALGVLAYEMLTGQPPFVGLNPQQTLAAHVNQPPVPLAQRRPGVGPGLDTLVMRCLAKRPADRFQTANELVLALEPLTTPSGGMTPHGITPHGTAPYQAVGGKPGRRVLTIAAGLALVTAAAWGASRVLAPQSLAIEAGRSRQVTRDPVPELFVAISPDGREVAYQSGWSELRTRIEVRDVEGGRPLILTGDWGGAQAHPGWTRDGRSVLFDHAGTEAERPSGVWKLPRLGGEAVRPDSADNASKFRGLTIRVFDRDSMGFTDAEGRSAVYALTKPLSDVVPSTLRIRHDGKAVAFMAGNPDYISSWTNIAPSAIWVLVPGDDPVRVTDATSLNASPEWLPDGSLLYVSNKGGTRDIWVVALDRNGRPRESTRKRLTTGLDAHTISVSDDGRKLAYTRMNVRQNIYAMPIPSGGVASVAAARPITTGNQIVERFAVSRDGKLLAFDSNLEGNQQIFVMPAAGGEPRRVTRNAADDFSPHFSGDASQIAFHTTRNGDRDIYVINTDGSGEQRLTTDAIQSFNPAFSPDGRRIAFGDLDIARRTSNLRLLERSGPGGTWNDPTAIDAPNGYAPRWSPDGRQLVYEVRGPANGGADRTGIAVLPLGGTSRVLVPSGGTWPEWSPDGQSIFYFGVENGEAGYYQVPARGGPVRKVIRFDVPQRRPWAASPAAIANGLVYFVLLELESDVYVMELIRG
jgi:eukaryotic-like serine/threonine-protein kinase